MLKAAGTRAASIQNAALRLHKGQANLLWGLIIRNSCCHCAFNWSSHSACLLLGLLIWLLTYTPERSEGGLGGGVAELQTTRHLQLILTDQMNHKNGAIYHVP